ncbi:MAG TPA: nitrilase-related carbon-nitrogen hydrolase [Candidatus Saccharimonadales bacterium]|nr:nitrilase-related carbon-nitrogen hydrolase [Candidatus Saccharimonadales bacterium]
MTSASRIKVAVCQYAPRLGRGEENATLGSQWIARAANAGARLIVLPELANSGYAFASSEEAELASESSADGPGLLMWAEQCRRLGVWVVAGFSERAKAGRFDSAALLGPTGVIGVYRKAHLFFNEQTYFQPGDSGFPVFDLPFGRVGMLICYDLWFPEAARVLSLAGADIICVPTNWVANFRRRIQDERGWNMGNYASVAVATQNQVYLAAADRIGSERDIDFVGGSCVVGPDGWMLAGPATRCDEALLLADVDLSQSAAKKQRTPRNHALGDRRPELYRELSATEPVASG